MAVIIQKGKGLAGIAKQAAKGSPAAHAWYAHGLTGGQPISVENTQAPLETTSGDRTERSGMRTGTAPAIGPWTSFAYLRALGLYLLGVYGSVVDAGAVGAYTHTYRQATPCPTSRAGAWSAASISKSRMRRSRVSV